jgi:hypothetical protein
MNMHGMRSGAGPGCARFMAWALLALALALTAGGCGETNRPDPPPPSQEVLVFPDTPDKLMANLQTVYEWCDLDGLRKLLGADHVTLLQAATQAYFPALGDRLERLEELRCHERLFSHRDVTDPEGTIIPAIVTVSFQTFARAGTWALSESTDPIPNTTCALYDVVVVWDRGPAYSVLKTQGQIRFYVTSRDSLVNGVLKPYYQVCGQKDLTQIWKAAAVEPTAWGTVKGMFR